MMDSRGAISDAVILDTAKSVGLDIDKVKVDMDAPAIDAVIKHNFELAAALKVHATPTIVIGNSVLPGVINAETLHALIARQRQHG
jgi:protein-disulfide isomerase